MSLQILSEWLRCPNCFLPLGPAGSLSLGCAAGHLFDVNKRGFITLINGPHKFIGDSAVMLDARDRFQSGGFYSPLREAISQTIAREKPRHIIDIGCGSGYYLHHALLACAAFDRVAPPRALAVDLSPAAVGRTVRASNQVDGLVADVWSPLAIRDAAADVILNVFAPRNATEFHRVLVPGGLLVVVIPQETHLQELRTAGLALSMQPDKARHLIDGLADSFNLELRQPLTLSLSLTALDVDSVLGMGPSSHHVANQGVVVAEPETSVTAAFDIFSFRRRPV